jgi:hypothetical protein
LPINWHPVGDADASGGRTVARYMAERGQNGLTGYPGTTP